MISWAYRYGSVIKYIYDQLGFSSSKPISVCYGFSFAPTVRRLAVHQKVPIQPRWRSPPTLHTGNRSRSKLFTIVTIFKHSHRAALCPSSPHVPLGGQDKGRGSQLKEPLVNTSLRPQKNPLCQIDDTVGVMWIMSDLIVAAAQSVLVPRATLSLTVFLQRPPPRRAGRSRVANGPSGNEKKYSPLCEGGTTGLPLTPEDWVPMQNYSKGCDRQLGLNITASHSRCRCRCSLLLLHLVNNSFSTLPFSVSFRSESELLFSCS